MNFKEKYLAKQREDRYVMERPPFPRIVKIDICNTCNYACVFCPQAKQTGKRGNIDDELCTKIIADAYRAGARELCLSSTGEPLLNRNLEKYIRQAKALGYTYVFFNTNGYLMDRSRAESVLAAGVDSVKFSINAGSAGTYKLVHGIDGYERVIENLIEMSRLRKEIRPQCKLYVSFVAVRQTRGEAAGLESKIGTYIDDFVAMNANSRGGSIREVEGILSAGGDEFSYQYPCSQLFHNLYVSAEGYVNICCQDFDNLTVVADLRETDVESAWHSEKFTAFRRKYLKKDLAHTLCANCVYGGDEEVVPLEKEKAYFRQSGKKIKNLQERIHALEVL